MYPWVVVSIFSVAVSAHSHPASSKNEYYEDFKEIDRETLLSGVTTNASFWDQAQELGSNIKGFVNKTDSKSYDKYMGYMETCFAQNWSLPMRSYLKEMVLMLTEFTRAIFKKELKGTYLEKVQKTVRLEHLIEFAARVKKLEGGLDHNATTKKEMDRLREDCKLWKDMDTFFKRMNAFGDKVNQMDDHHDHH